MYGCKLVNSGLLPPLGDEDEDNDEDVHSRDKRTHGTTVTFTRCLARKAIHEIRSKRATIERESRCCDTSEDVLCVVESNC